MSVTGMQQSTCKDRWMDGGGIKNREAEGGGRGERWLWGGLQLGELPPAGETERRMGVRLERGPSELPPPTMKAWFWAGRCPRDARRTLELSQPIRRLSTLVLIEMQPGCPRTASAVTDDN